MRNSPITPEKRLPPPPPINNPQPRRAKRPPVQRLLRLALEQVLHLLGRCRSHDGLHLLRRKEFLLGITCAGAGKTFGDFCQSIGDVGGGGEVEVGRGPEEVEEVVQG